jgi:hypothetical protein
MTKNRCENTIKLDTWSKISEIRAEFNGGRSDNGYENLFPLQNEFLDHSVYNERLAGSLLLCHVFMLVHVFH